MKVQRRKSTRKSTRRSIRRSIRRSKKVVSKKPEAFVDYTDADDTAASRLALVVGKIVDVWPHPDSDKLFCEKIDCGEAFGPVSGFFFAYSSSEVVKTNVGRGDGVLLR